MELQSPIRDNLCKTFRAAGLPKERALPLVNEVEKWYNHNGVEWTVDRLKDLHNWYISKLAGTPNIPSWIAHHAEDPKGPFRCVFKMKNIGAALTILSCHTQFTNVRVSNTQLRKLDDGLNSKEVQCKLRGRNLNLRVPKLTFTSPTLSVLTGVSIPAGSLRYHPNKEDSTFLDKVVAYKQSWFYLPGETATFIRDGGLTELAPEVLLDRAYRLPVGTISCLQEPSLKARWISNPNRITQHFLDPLRAEWAAQLGRRFPLNDCTKKQFSGAEWAQSKLRDGVALASVDLTSATDKLNLVPCLDVLHLTYYESTLTGNEESWLRQPDGHRYLAAIRHFCDVSRGAWLYGGIEKEWKVGWPLGTKPSFALLATVNCVAASMACRAVGIHRSDGFRVVGDDIVIRAEAMEAYVRNISRLGGVVNPTKTIVSDRVAEFAGYVITPRAIFPKRVNTRDLSDNSFMLVANTIGPQAVGCLHPRQRRVWKALKDVPGVAVGGNYPLQQVGNDPMWHRYLWYLCHVENSDKDIGKASDFSDPKQDLVRMVMALKETEPSLLSSEDTKWWVPRAAFGEIPTPPKPWEIEQISKATQMKVESGDPRLVDGKTVLEVGEALLEKESFIPYPSFKSVRPSIDYASEVKVRMSLLPSEPTMGNGVDEDDCAQPTPIPPKPRRKPRKGRGR